MFVESTLLLPWSFILSSVVRSAFMPGPGSCGQTSRDTEKALPGGVPRAREEARAGGSAPGPCGGGGNNGSPAEVSKCEKARVQATWPLLHREEGVPGIGGPCSPCGMLPTSCFLASHKEDV